MFTIFKTVSILILLLPLTGIAQGIIHPAKKGFGYHYYHIFNNTNITGSHMIYFSTGKFDLYANISNINLSETTKLNSVVGLNIIAHKEEKPVIPYTSFYIGAVNHTILFGVAQSLALRLYQDSFIRFTPELGVSYSFFIIGDADGLATGLGIATSMNTTLLLSEKSLLTISPNYGLSNSESIFGITIGVSYLL